ncbi:ATP-binding protein [Candidatus Nitrospira bockiana]
MTVRWPAFSVTMKIGAVFMLLALVFIVLLTVNGYLAQQLIGAGAAINAGGSQRMRIYKLAFLLGDRTSLTPHLRSSVEEEMRQIEYVLTSLSESQRELGWFRVSDPDITTKIDVVQQQWGQDVKPALTRVLQATPEEFQAARRGYDVRVASFVSSWSDLVEAIDRRAADRVQVLYRLQFSFLIFAGVLWLFAVWVLRRVVRDPLRALAHGAEQMAVGVLPTSIPVRSHDELGRLAATFEWMAGRIHQHLHHLEALRLTGQEITMLEAGGLEQVLRRIADRAADLLKADLAVLLVRHPVLDCWVVEAASGKIFDAIRKQVLLFEETPLTTRVFETRAPIFVNDLSEHADKQIRFRDEFAAKSYMAVPVSGPRELIGVLVLLQTSAVRVFTDQDVKLTEHFCSYAAVAIENARLLETVEAESHDLKHKLEALERKVADLTHEVKAPAGRVAEFASWIVKDYGARLDERARRYLDWIQKEGKDLSDLAERTLDVARLVRERRVVESVDVGSVVQEVLELHAGRLKARGIVVSVAKDLPHFACRRIHLKQVLGNLIDNAVKYMGDQSSPRIEIGEQGGLLYVRDNGIGIEPGMAEAIFEPFHRVGTVDAPGAGLGLSIVKTVVEHYGGSVTVESKPDEGSTFYVRLPVLLRETVAPGSERQGEPVDGGGNHEDDQRQGLYNPRH